MVDRNVKLIDAGLALAGELSLPALLQRMVGLAMELCDARYGALGVLSVDGTRIDEFITVGMTDEEVAAMPHPPVGEGILGALIDEKQSLRLDDIADDPRSSGFPEGHPMMHSFLGAPVVARKVAFGNIYLTEKDGGGPFTADDEATLNVLAVQAGVAVENARLYEEAVSARRDLERLAVMEDRERIARELHDGAIQSLFAVGMGLQGIVQSLDDPEAVKRIEGTVVEIDRVIRDLRNYIFGLRPGILADRQLDQAIRGLAEDFQVRSGVVTIVDVDADLAAGLASRAGDIVQLVREALSNVGRHAAAATCRVSLRALADGSAELTIDDDGIGFDVDAVSLGNGVENMRTRAATLGADFSIASVASEGTTVTITMPVA